MKPRSSQRKGKQGEIELADRLTSLFGVECKRMASAYLPGIVAPDVYGLPGIHVESKRRERVPLYAAIRQARHDACGRVAIVAHRGNGRPWLVTVTLEDLPTLARSLVGIKDQTTSHGAVVVREPKQAG
jgi:hypothetical protein